MSRDSYSFIEKSSIKELEETFIKKPYRLNLEDSNFVNNAIIRNRKVIKLLIDFILEINIDYTFRNYYYIRATIKLLLNKKIKKSYLNIDYFIILIN